MHLKDNSSMYNENTKGDMNFAPRQDEDRLWESNDNPDERQPTCSPSKIFSRHRSLAELSTVAATEKEALDRQESSQCSDISENGSTNDPESQEYNCSSQNVGAQLEVHSTPTKACETESLLSNDPLTPTANLKLFMSVVSPVIRDRDEKKRDLFVNDAKGTTSTVVVDKQINTLYNRKDRSLGLLCQRFLAKFPEDPGKNALEISLDEISKDLKVERRRVYDIVNVLESVEVLSRLAKNRYLWHGKSRIAQTLGKLKALSSKSMLKSSKQLGKENISNTPGKMKRHFSFGDVPKANRQLQERNLNKDEERLMIKAALDCTDNCRKDKSLGVLSQKFLIMFLLSKGGVVTLDDAATVLLEEHDEKNVKYKTKVRRLYDIANILSSLKLIEKVHIRGSAGKKPGFKWIGVDIDGLPDKQLVPSENVITYKTKHSLLPDPNIQSTTTTHSLSRGPVRQQYLLPSPSPSQGTPHGHNKRWSKSVSCNASFIRRYSSKDEGGIKREKSNGSVGDGPDGFLVHEFASSPVNLLGRDMSLYSPTEVTFREEIQKLQERFPTRMSQLLAVLPPRLPSSCPGSGSKSSRRNLFSKDKSGSSEANTKRLRTNSEGDFHAVTSENTIGTEESAQTKETDENEDPSKRENETKFMHSTNSPFKVMSACAYSDSEKAVPANTNPAGSGMPVFVGRTEREGVVKEPRQRSSCQWQHIVGHSTSPMVKFVDQAISPIPPSKLPPRASIAVQASLVKDISPLKPLVFLHHRIPSPWKPPTGPPSTIPPAPPSTPELPNEGAMGPFQSQPGRMFIRSVSPYPRSVSPYLLSASQSCGSSPVGLFNEANLFFPPSPNTKNMVLTQGNLLYGSNQVMIPHSMTPPLSTPQSNSCPSSVNPSPISIDAYTPGNVALGNVVSQSPMPLPEFLTLPATMTPASEPTKFTPCQPHPAPTGKQPCILMNAGGLGETPTSDLDAAANENVARKLCLTNESA